MSAETVFSAASGEWSLDAPAKVNLFLEIVRRRDDGYHDLVSLFQTIPLCDHLCVREAEALSLVCDAPGIPLDESNLILKAARALQEAGGVRDGAAFTLRKRIPDGGGLGGGSSDAAAALLLCNKLWALDLSREELAEIGSRIGSDVPFFLYGGVCRCEGRGEIITPLPELVPLPVAVAAPDWKISTPLAYRNLRPEEFNQRGADDYLQAWREYSMLARKQRGKGSEATGQNADLLRRLHETSFNRFEETAFRLEPRQRDLQAALRRSGWLPRLSGSGSCCWLLAERENPERPVGFSGLRILDCRPA